MVLARGAMSPADTVEALRQRLCEVFHKHTSMSQHGTRRKLVLHFDVNKTLTAVDSATGETVQDALNVYLSGMAWGKAREGRWESSRGNLSHAPTDSDDVSFYKFEEHRMLRQLSRDRSSFRNYLSSFTDKPQGSNFKPYLTALLQRLRWPLPYHEVEHRGLTVPGTENCRYHFILPAFYTLLHHLVTTQRHFVILLRTYGCDAKHVIDSIRTAIERDMPFCQNLKLLHSKVSETMFVLKREENGLFSFSPETPSENLTDCFSDVVTDTKCLKSDHEMYSIFSRASGICAVQDDVRVWYQNDFHPTKGKPMWIDTADVDVQHVFFDDNIRPGAADSIVNIRVKSSPDSFRNVERAEEHKFVYKNIVPVVLSEAIMDTDYFIKELERCERNYTEHLKSKYSKTCL